jgi:hypothetical protein
MLHIYYNNSAWTYEDLTQKAGGPSLPIWPDSGVAVFVAGVNGEVYGVTNDQHFQQFTRFGNGTWGDLDLTTYESAPTKTYGGIAAFDTPPNKQYHIYYAPSTAGTEIYQLFFNGTSWAVDDLTGGVGQADYYADITGFAIGNLQHVFYFDSQN